MNLKVSEIVSNWGLVVADFHAISNNVSMFSCIKD